MKNSAQLVSIVGFILVTQSIVASASDYIVGGAAVKKNDPIAATTVAVLNGDALCSGSIVSDDLVVTAAHCVGPDKSQMKIVFKKSLKGELPTAAVLGYVVPKEYAGDKASGKDQNDIALVRFEGSLPEGYRAAQILPATEILRDGETVTLAGFGITRAKTHVGAGTLRKVEVTIENAEYGKSEVLLDQTHQKGACHGDSGGPAFVMDDNGDPLLWGVTSRAAPSTAPDDCAHQAIYTSVRAFSHFLDEAAGELRK
jgi:secreted trypsin-like serine protease